MCAESQRAREGGREGGRERQKGIHFEDRRNRPHKTEACNKIISVAPCCCRLRPLRNILHHVTEVFELTEGEVPLPIADACQDLFVVLPIEGGEVLGRIRSPLCSISRQAHAEHGAGGAVIPQQVFFMDVGLRHVHLGTLFVAAECRPGQVRARFNPFAQRSMVHSSQGLDR